MSFHDRTIFADAPLPAPATPEGRALRIRIESAIDSLIALLDEIDGDPDLEGTNENGDELDCGEQTNEDGTDLDDGEDGDDNGIADAGGLFWFNMEAFGHDSDFSPVGFPEYPCNPIQFHHGR